MSNQITQSQPLQLEVGRTYSTKRNLSVKILREDQVAWGEVGVTVYIGSNDIAYYADGSEAAARTYGAMTSAIHHPDPLVRLVDDTADSLARETILGPQVVVKDVPIVEHQFRFREDGVVKFSLPADLNPAEAQRIAQFILLLPQGQSSGFGYSSNFGAPLGFMGQQR